MSQDIRNLQSFHECKTQQKWRRSSQRPPQQQSALRSYEQLLDIDWSLPVVLFFGNKNPQNQFMSSFARVKINVCGIDFKTNEHYIMYRKALLKGDTEATIRITLANDPLDARFIGQKLDIANPHRIFWERCILSIVNDCNYAKFTQYPELAKQLLATGKAPIGEVTPDPLWGIGLTWGNPDVQDTQAWFGKNISGRSLMQIRERLFNEQCYHLSFLSDTFQTSNDPATNNNKGNTNIPTTTTPTTIPTTTPTTTPATTPATTTTATPATPATATPATTIPATTTPATTTAATTTAANFTPFVQSVSRPIDRLIPLVTIPLEKPSVALQSFRPNQLQPFSVPYDPVTHCGTFSDPLILMVSDTFSLEYRDLHPDLLSSWRTAAFDCQLQTKPELGPTWSSGRIAKSKRNFEFFSNVSGAVYEISRKMFPGQPLTSKLTEMMEVVNKERGEVYDAMIINEYEDGKQSIGYHSDNPKHLGSKGIDTMSFGQVRTCIIRHKGSHGAPGEEVLSIECADGSLLSMMGDFQKYYTHEITTDSSTKPRRSVTFRWMQRSSNSSNKSM